MDKHYRKYITILLAALFVFSIVTSVFFLFAINMMVRKNSDILHDLTIERAREELSRTIDNVEIRIEHKKTIINDEVNKIIDLLLEYVETSGNLPQVHHGIGSRLSSLQYGSAVKLLVEYKIEGEKTYLVTANTTEEVASNDEAVHKEIDASPIKRTYETEETILYIFVTQSAIDELVKEHIRHEIHETVYGDESYVWVNEIINYEGGDDYAIRIVHPNMIETEGTYLSTKTEDIAGNQPYLTELKGIKKEGEVFHSYYFKRMNSEEIAEKVSYARLYEPYDWIIATGEPMEDILYITEEVRRESGKIGNILVSCFVLAEAVLLIWIIRIQKRFRKTIDSYVRTETELDALTGALTRKAGQAELEKYFKLFQENGGTYMLIMMDVDKFKGINDTHGHATGDKVLRQVSQVMLANIRENDRLIRWGGDEFVLLCIGVEEEKQPSVANKLLNCIRALQVGTVQQPISLTLSMGYSSFMEGDQSYQQTMLRVDEALYHSKATGRNKYTSYEHLMEEKAKKLGKDKV